MELESERLLLRRYRDEDFEFLYSLVKEPRVMRHIGNGKIKNRQQALELLYWVYHSYREDPQCGPLLITRRLDGRRIGHAGLSRQVVDGAEELEVGYWLAPDFWGCGYAKEAAALLCDSGFQQPERARLISLIHPENHASRKVAEALGMDCGKEIVRNGQAVLVYCVEKERWHAISNT